MTKYNSISSRFMLSPKKCSQMLLSIVLYFSLIVFTVLSFPLLLPQWFGGDSGADGRAGCTVTRGLAVRILLPPSAQGHNCRGQTEADGWIRLALWLLLVLNLVECGPAVQRFKALTGHDLVAEFVLQMH